MAGRRVVFGGGESDEHAVEVLHVGDVAADADDGCGIEGTEAFDVGEAGEGAVGSWREEVSLGDRLRLFEK